MPGAKFAKISLTEERKHFSEKLTKNLYLLGNIAIICLLFSSFHHSVVDLAIKPNCKVGG